MIVRNISTKTFQVDLTEDELYHYMLIIAASPSLCICSVDELIKHVLTYCEQNYHTTIKEPKTYGDANT